MTDITIDPRTALLAIDLQRGVMGATAAHPIPSIVDNAVQLAESFRAAGLPVVLVTVSGGPGGRTERSRGAQSHQRPEGWDQLIDELGQSPTDHTVVKRAWGAFTNTDLDGYLRERDVTQVVIVGIATSIGVESTARSAHELGYNVTIAIDAITDTDPDAHRHSVEKIFPRLGETGTTSEILGILNRKN